MNIYMAKNQKRIRGYTCRDVQDLYNGNVSFESFYHSYISGEIRTINFWLIIQNNTEKPEIIYIEYITDENEAKLYIQDIMTVQCYFLIEKQNVLQNHDQRKQFPSFTKVVGSLYQIQIDEDKVIYAKIDDKKYTIQLGENTSRNKYTRQCMFHLYNEEEGDIYIPVSFYKNLFITMVSYNETDTETKETTLDGYRDKKDILFLKIETMFPANKKN